MTLYTLSETEQLAFDISKQVRPSTPILLYGDLGSGKTTFSRFLIRKLIKTELIDIPSPTFNIINVYEADHTVLWHCDLYRIKIIDEIFELGLIDAINQYTTIIEWPEKIEPYLPQKNISLSFKIIDEQTRQIDIKE